MERFKNYSYDPLQLIPISFRHQILPRSFEYTLSYLIDHELDTSIFHSRFKNDDNGRPAYDPALLLKIVLLAYSKGITSSRKIEQLCRENIIFMAISANHQPHFTTITDFISSSNEAISQLFLQVLLICYSQGLIGKEMFAVDGCKISSNASKEWSGTFEDLAHKQQKMEAGIAHILKKHKETDQKDLPEEIREREERQVATLKRASNKIKDFLAQNKDRVSKAGFVIQSNITDNDSAKIKSSHGVIQGYNGVATVDSKHQIIVQAEAYGSGHEHGLLKPSSESAFEHLQMTGDEKKELKVLADSGFHDADTLSFLAENQLDGYIVDQRFRNRDPRFETAKRHHKKRPKPAAEEPFLRDRFQADLENESCVCPAGKQMRLRQRNSSHQGYLVMRFAAKASDCNVCTLREECLRSPDKNRARHIEFRMSRIENQTGNLIDAMKAKVDSEWGRYIYSWRLGIVEPVFGNVRWALGLDWFSLRGKQKVNGQWKLMATLHNLLKLQKYGTIG
jgi:transposase